MSRGPGVLQVQVMQTLKGYHDLGAALDWQWCVGGSWQRKHAYKGNIDGYETGRYVPVWILRRDLKVAPPLLSRALHGLQRMGYVGLSGADLEHPGDRFSCSEYVKFVSLHTDGERWLSDNKSKITKLSLKAGSP